MARIDHHHNRNLDNDPASNYYEHRLDHARLERSRVVKKEGADFEDHGPFFETTIRQTDFLSKVPPVPRSG
jgi:hypothetical protein